MENPIKMDDVGGVPHFRKFQKMMMGRTLTNNKQNLFPSQSRVAFSSKTKFFTALLAYMIYIMLDID
jgi:hypothetical protein